MFSRSRDGAGDQARFPFIQFNDRYQVLLRNVLTDALPAPPGCPTFTFFGSRGKLYSLLFSYWALPDKFFTKSQCIISEFDFVDTDLPYWC